MTARAEILELLQRRPQLQTRAQQAQWRREWHSAALRLRGDAIDERKQATKPNYDDDDSKSTWTFDHPGGGKVIVKHEGSWFKWSVQNSDGRATARGQSTTVARAKTQAMRGRS